MPWAVWAAIAFYGAVACAMDGRQQAVVSSHFRHWHRQIDMTPGADLQDMIDSAIAIGKTSLSVPSGDYDFGEKALLIANAQDLRIQGAGNDANGTSLWFTPGYGIELVNCTGVIFDGFSYDTSIASFSQGTVVAVDTEERAIVAEIDPGFPLPIATSSELFNQTCPDGSQKCGEIKVIYWDQSTQRMHAGQEMSNPVHSATCDGRKCTVKVRAPLSFVPAVGSGVTMSPRAFASKYPIPSYYKGTLLVSNCTHVIVSNFNQHSAADMAHLENLGGGGHVYENCNIVRRPNPPYPFRLLASNSDGFHSFSVEKGPTLRNSEFAFLGDDFINLHNRLLPIASVDPSSSLLHIVDPGDILGHDKDPNAHGSQYSRRITHTTSSIRKGDHLKLYATTPTPSFALVASVTVESIRILSVDDMPPLPSMLAGRIEPDGLKYLAITFSSAAKVPRMSNYSGLVQFDRLASFNGVIENNLFRDSYNNAGRLAASNLLIQNNTFLRCGDGIHVSYDIAESFLEGSLGMSNITIMNNSFQSVTDRLDCTVPAGCTQICETIPCVLDHIDTALQSIVHADGNRVSS